MEAYLSLAEFSISLAGFTGVIVVFVQKDQKWLELDKFRVINALLASLGASFLSLIPYGLSYLDYNNPKIFQIHSFCIAMYLLLVIASVLWRRNKNLTDLERSQLPKKMVRILILIGILLITVHFTIQVGLIQLSLNGLNYFSIVYLLLLSTFAFSRIIFYRPKSD